MQGRVSWHCPPSPHLAAPTALRPAPEPTPRPRPAQPRAPTHPRAPPALRHQRVQGEAGVGEVGARVVAADGHRRRIVRARRLGRRVVAAAAGAGWRRAVSRVVSGGAAGALRGRKQRPCKPNAAIGRVRASGAERRRRRRAAPLTCPASGAWSARGPGSPPPTCPRGAAAGGGGAEGTGRWVSRHRGATRRQQGGWAPSPLPPPAPSSSAPKSRPATARPGCGVDLRTAQGRPQATPQPSQAP